jgi:hypothetical protein
MKPNKGRIIYADKEESLNSLCELIKNNDQSIKRLGIFIKDDTPCKKIFEALRNNTSIHVLSIAFNIHPISMLMIPDSTIRYLSQALRCNTTLKMFSFGPSNYFCSGSGITYICNALLTSNVSLQCILGSTCSIEKTADLSYYCRDYLERNQKISLLVRRVVYFIIGTFKCLITKDVAMIIARLVWLSRGNVCWINILPQKKIK